MKRYLLLGWKAETRKGKFDRIHGPTDLQYVPGQVVPLVRGDAQEIIRAAAAAQCAVLLMDLMEIPTAGKPPVR